MITWTGTFLRLAGHQQSSPVHAVSNPNSSSKFLG